MAAKLDDPVSFKRLGWRACLICVSSSPSEIPYGGFSPVRLQTGCQPQPSPTRAYMRPRVHAPTAWDSPHSVGARDGCVSTPIQRPLARQRVVVSRRVVAYYGLIRASGMVSP